MVIAKRGATLLRSVKRRVLFAHYFLRKFISGTTDKMVSNRGNYLAEEIVIRRLDEEFVRDRLIREMASLLLNFKKVFRLLSCGKELSEAARKRLFDPSKTNHIEPCAY